MFVFSCYFDFRLRFHRSLHLCSALVHAFQSDAPPLRPCSGRRRGSPRLVHSDAHIYHRSPAGPPRWIHTCDLAQHLIPPAIQSSLVPELAESPWVLLGPCVSLPLYPRVPTTTLKTNDRSSPALGSSSPTSSLFTSQPRSRSPRPQNYFPMAG